MSGLKKNSNKEKGALAIDAILGITFFFVTVLSIMFISLIVRVQANIQYALGQTAKEISGYYYLLDKIGVAAATTGSDSSGVKDIDETVGYVIDFSDEAVDMSDKVSKINITDGISMDDFKNIDKDDVKKLYKTAGDIGSKLEIIGDDPKGQITAVLSVFAKTMVNKGLSYYIAPMVCKAIMPRYMGGNKEAANKMLNAAGITGGIDSLDFTQSQLLTDKRSIKLVVYYELNAADFTFGIVDKKMIFCQAASTAAWINPDQVNTYKISQLTIPEIVSEEPEEEIKVDLSDSAPDDKGGISE